MNVGFIGFGEAAYNIALGLYGEGLHGIKAHDALQNDPMMGKLVHKRAEEAHVELVDSSTAIAQWADVILQRCLLPLLWGFAKKSKEF